MKQRGRPKGHSPYIEIRYEELSDWVGRKTKVPVSKKWLQALMGEDDEDKKVLDSSPTQDYSEETEQKIEYNLEYL
ncbi:MAG: hypothetical protein EBY39_07435 [Flavobacteriia bacterium]|nr:hypothetical protein [Flavobacteriia bacterium]